MPLDGISSRFLSAELSRDLKDARVDRISQPGRFDLLLTLRVPGANRRLFVSCNPSSPRAYLLPSDQIAPRSASPDRQPPMFCMLLRKHLQGARLQSVTTMGFERLLDFNFQVRNEYGDLTTRRLICELMGRHSNIILLNEDSRILDALVHVDSSLSSRREIMPARAYAWPPAQGKIKPDDLLALLQRGQELSFLHSGEKTNRLDRLLLDHIAGLAPIVCSEICLQAGLMPDMDPVGLTAVERESLLLSLKDLMTRALADRPSPCLIYGNGPDLAPTDFHALSLSHISDLSPTSSLSEAMGLYFPQKEDAQRLAQQKSNLSRSVEKAIRHQVKLLGIYERDLKSGKNYEYYRQLGDLIYSNLHLVRPGLNAATVTDYSSPEAGDRIIELKPELSPSQNAQRYYKLYQKNKSRCEAALAFKERAEAELTYLSTLLTMVEQAENSLEISDLKKEWQAYAGGGSRHKDNRRNHKRSKGKKTAGKSGGQEARPLPPRHFTSSQGFSILVGRNNRQNDELTLRRANKDDLWFHLQKAPGTHVIVRTEGKDVPGRTIEEAAGLAAWFSLSETKRREVGSGGAVDVDFCPAGQVRKPAGARPGMVIYDHYRTIRIKPLSPASLPEEG